jgi:hypothetical protein
VVLRVPRRRTIEIAAGISVVVACGARTELLSPEEPADVGVDVRDAASEDALPSIDQFQSDTPIPTDCPDAGATLIYVITSQNELFSFYPPTLVFSKIGDIACPDTEGGTPWSMAVDRLGTAYSVFDDGLLWQISTQNASCQPTSYVPPTQDAPFFVFGMGYAGDQTSESLYIADARFSMESAGLATIDTMTFTRSFIADFQPELPRCELTGTGDGRLFAFCLPTMGNGSTLAEVDRMTAQVIAENTLMVGGANDAFAYAFWGGVFWIFTSPGMMTTVTRYDPSSMSETEVTTMGSTVVGAGVSTCAPR